MEKEALLSELTKKIGTTNLTDRTLSEYVDAILPTIQSDDQINDAFWGIHTKVLGSMSGQLRHEISTGIEEFKKNYKPAQTTPPAGVVKPASEEGTDLTTIRGELLNIVNENKSLKERLDKREQQETQEALAKRIKETMKGQIKPDAFNEGVFKYVFKGETLDSTKSDEDLVKHYLGIYNTEYSEATKGGGAPWGGSQSGGGKSDYDFDEFFSEKARQGKFPSKEKK